MLMIWELVMPVKARKLLSLQETQDSLAMLSYLTKTGNRGYIPYPAYIQPVALSVYDNFAQKLQSTKNHKLFTHSPTGMPTEFPNLYLTKLGQLAIPVIRDCMNNPFINGQFKKMTLHPLIAHLGETVIKYQLPAGGFLNHDYFEQAADVCFADFKVRGNTNQFSRILSSWITTFKSSANTINRFMDIIVNKAPRFEVHSIVVQLKTSAGHMPQFGEENFRDQSEAEMLEELAQPIIKKVWQNKNANNVIGILSKDEIDLIGDRSKRLIFFVKKEFSDLENWTDTILNQTLYPFFENTITHQINYGDIASMNAGITPLFQGQHLNYYDLHQPGIAPRLVSLKANLYGTDYWMRVDGNQPTVKIERQYG